MRLIVVIAGMILFFGLCAAGDVQASSRTPINIVPQGLGPALQTLAMERGFQIVYVSDEVNAVRTEGAVGEFTSEEALKKLLNGTRLTFHYLDDKTVTVVPMTAAVEPNRRLAQAPRAAAAEPAPAPQADAPSGGEDALQEIVVTAEKRSEGLQKVPMAISAFTGDAMTKSHITDIQSLAGSIPNVNFGQYVGNAQISIRGLGYDSINPGAEGRVALHEDGVYLSRPSAGTSSFYDVDRVEVLRGPQGTLYGRNATAGSVNIITREPTQETSGYLQQTYGNYNDSITEGAVGGAISPSWSYRVAGQTEFRDGYGKNIATNHEIDNVNSQSARGKLLYDPGSRFSLLLSADFHQEHDRNDTLLFINQLRPDLPPAGGLAFGGQPAPRPRDVDYTEDPSNNRLYWGASATAKLDLDYVQLKSITGYRYSYYNQTGSLDGLSGNFLPYVQSERSNAYSEELQATHTGDTVKWLAGIFYFNERDNLATTFPVMSEIVGILPNRQLQGYYAGGLSRTDAAAVFGQVSYQFTDRFSVTVGERVGWEKKSKDDATQFDVARDYNPANPVQPSLQGSGQIQDRYQTPKISFNFQLDPQTLLFASYSVGYKSGGFDIGSVTPAYRPETLTDFEVGLKAQFFDNRLRTNIALFDYYYKDIQLSVNDNFVLAIENASRAKLYGIEAESRPFPLSGLEIGITLGYLHSRYDGYETIDPSYPELGLLDRTGNQLEEAPEFNSELSARYTWTAWQDWSLSLGADWKYKSRVYFTPFENDVVSAPGHNTADASFSATSPDKIWSVTLYGRNITDTRSIAYAIPTSAFAGYTVLGTYEPPATYGITPRITFERRNSRCVSYWSMAEPWVLGASRI